MRVTARELDCQHIWNAHAGSARKAGVPGALVDALRDRKELPALAPDEAAVVQFGREFFRTRRVSRGILEHFRAEHGSKRVATLKFQHVEAILLAKSKKRVDPETGRQVGGKSAAFNLRKQLTRLFDYAVKLEMIPALEGLVHQALTNEYAGGKQHSFKSQNGCQKRKRNLSPGTTPSTAP